MSRAVFQRLREEKSTFRDSEEKAADYILGHAGEVVNLPITELAERIGVSEATIVRMCKKIGFRGFQELKINLAIETVSPIQAVHEEISEGDDVGLIMKKLVSANVHTLEATLDVLSEADLRLAVERLSEARAIQLYGVGGSGPVALDAAHKLMKTGKPVTAYTDSHMQAMAAALVEPGDVVVGISHSGSSRDIIDALAIAKARKATTIGITRYARTPMDKVLDIKLGTSSYETLYRMESTSSRIAQLVIVDALFIGICLRDPERAVQNIRVTREAIAPKRF
ncbi:MAG: putative HTH-type transcriptional regulator YbbH [Firmicutes bacterium ADurb.Bin506]|jgi:RpiR family carbohydrate utilization transcriptional regulator|nr:MAG: putative HTH-type transcriptional regulator YbbH [Firmicutes bacterium ADurb.Bin506]